MFYPELSKKEREELQAKAKEKAEDRVKAMIVEEEAADTELFTDLDEEKEETPSKVAGLTLASWHCLKNPHERNMTN